MSAASLHTPTHSLQHSNNQTASLDQVQTLIAEVTGSDPEEIRINTYLEEFSLEDFPKIIAKINRTFNIALHPKEVISEYETIGELVSLIEEELELG